MTTYRNNWTKKKKNQEGQKNEPKSHRKKKTFLDACCGKPELLRLQKTHAGRKQGNENLKYVVNIKDKFNIFVQMS